MDSFASGQWKAHVQQFACALGSMDASGIFQDWFAPKRVSCTPCKLICSPFSMPSIRGMHVHKLPIKLPP